MMPSSAARRGARDQRGQARVEGDPGGRVLTGGQQRGVPPDVVRAGLDLLRG